VSDDAVEFQELVLGHLDSFWNYARLLGRRQEAAEDLLQEALARAFQGFAGFDRTRSFKGWMFATIKHAHIDQQRRRRARSLVAEVVSGPDAYEETLALDNPLCSTPLAPDELLLRRETIERVREAIQLLPDQLREVVGLRDMEGLAYQEIAHIVQCPIGTVMSRLYRGRNLLRTYLLEGAREAGRTGGVHGRL
jgi:RNA polymerase sigma-70 factor (ECF subfamily)